MQVDCFVLASRIADALEAQCDPLSAGYVDAAQLSMAMLNGTFNLIGIADALLKDFGMEVRCE